MQAPHLAGAKRVRLKLEAKRHHADQNRNVQIVADAWKQTRTILARAAGMCGCGNRWSHIMNGVDVTLTDKAPYTARFWDDDRLAIHLQRFSEEQDGAATLVHEFGHRVWFQCLTREQQDRWKESWLATKNSGARPRWASACGGVVTDYACTDELEDFAEVFQKVVYGRVDRHNLGRWLDLCGCNGVKAKCESGRKGRRP